MHLSNTYPPRQAAADGSYASRDNLRQAKARGVRDMAFHKKGGLRIEDMVRSRWVYRKLRNFRAGIEAGEEAMAVGGPEDAARHFEAVLDLVSAHDVELPEDLDLAVLVSRTADAVVASGQPARAVRLVEEHLRRALILSRGDPMIFVERPISAVLLALAVATLVVVALPMISRKRETVFVDD